MANLVKILNEKNFESSYEIYAKQAKVPIGASKEQLKKTQYQFTIDTYED